MIRNALRRERTTELPEGFLDWQVRLRHWTMVERAGSPHVGVAPLLLVRRPGVGPGTSAHSIICGLLPAAALLERRTQEFRVLYEGGLSEGARAIYDRGIAHLRDGYYRSSEGFDRTSVTTLLPREASAAVALAADQRCALVFHVFDVDDTSEIGRLRCLQLDCHAELHESGPVYDNVFWHNALFHGVVEDHVVVRFRHQSAYDTRFGGLEEVR